MPQRVRSKEMKISFHQCKKCGALLTVKETGGYFCVQCKSRESLTEADLDKIRSRREPSTN